jgi:hypothetical protein
LLDIVGSDYETDGQRSEPAWRPAFRASRWFTRGWTLQELLAPVSVEFFTKGGQRLGDKGTLEQEIHEITGIAVPALRRRALSEFDVEERFRWAQTRQTTREEDWAYSLLGIFGVFMPLLYGEGKANAVRRLRKEISDAIDRDDTIRREGMPRLGLSEQANILTSHLRQLHHRRLFAISPFHSNATRALLTAASSPSSRGCFRRPTHIRAPLSGASAGLGKLALRRGDETC